MNRQALTEEPSTGWALLSRCLIVVCLLLLFGGLAVKFLPRLSDLKQADAQIATLKEKVAELERTKDRLEQTSILLTQDKAFIEYKARDYLGMKQENEKVFRFKD
jgi:cell division protein FtsB